MSGVSFEAVPHAGKAGLAVNELGEPHFVWPNRIVLPVGVQQNLRARTVRVTHPNDRRLLFRTNADWIVNRLADVDEYGSALWALSRSISERTPVFNHPDAIAATRRDISSQVMQGIHGLVVPLCRRFTPYHVDAFKEFLADGAFVYPLLIRPAASQSGIGLCRINCDDDFLRYLDSCQLGKPYFVTQYVDCLGEDQCCTKIRVAFVGEQLFLRGYAKEKQWNIHLAFGNTPSDEMVAQFLQKEREFDKMADLRRVADEIRCRGGLDFWGVDLGLLDDGRFVLFEANAAMSLLKPAGLTEVQGRMVSPVIARMTQALKAHMADPDAWVNPFGAKRYDAIDPWSVIDG